MQPLMHLRIWVPFGPLGLKCSKIVQIYINENKIWRRALLNQNTDKDEEFNAPQYYLRESYSLKAFYAEICPKTSDPGDKAISWLCKVMAKLSPLSPKLRTCLWFVR